MFVCFILLTSLSFPPCEQWRMTWGICWESCFSLLFWLPPVSAPFYGTFSFMHFCRFWHLFRRFPQTEYFVLNKSFTRHSKTGQCHFNSSWKEASPSLRWVLTVLMSVYFWSKGKQYIYIDKRPSLESNTGPSCWLASLLTTTLSRSLYIYIVIVHHCKTS